MWQRPVRDKVGQRSRALSRIHVSALPGQRARGKLVAGTSVVPCVFGPAGIVRSKREGDGATPAGRFALERLLFRTDRGPRPASQLPIGAIGMRDGWCDDPQQPAYNRPVPLPFVGRHERLWRDDRLYDLLAVVDYNRHPPRRMRGSAIFLHVHAALDRPTAGCIAVGPADLRRLATRLGRRTCLIVQ